MSSSGLALVAVLLLAVGLPLFVGLDVRSLVCKAQGACRQGVGGSGEVSEECPDDLAFAQPLGLGPVPRPGHVLVLTLPERIGKTDDAIHLET